MERKGVLPVLPRRAPWQVSPFSTASKAAQSLPYRLTQQHCCMESPWAKTEAIWRLLAWTHKEKRKTFSALPVQCCSHYYCLSYFSSCGTTGLYYWPHCYSRVSLISINNFFFFKKQYAFPAKPQTKTPKHTATPWAELKLMALYI